MPNAEDPGRLFCVKTVKNRETQFIIKKEFILIDELFFPGNNCITIDVSLSKKFYWISDEPPALSDSNNRNLPYKVA